MSTLIDPTSYIYAMHGQTDIMQPAQVDFFMLGITVSVNHYLDSSPAY